MPTLTEQEIAEALGPAPITQRADVAPSSAGAFGAAFRLENPIMAVAELMDRPKFSEVEGYDYTKDLKTIPELAANYRSVFRGTRSPEEFQYRAAKLRKELQDAQKLEAAGLTGVLYGVAAGLVSPTTLLPVFGIKSALKATTAAGRALGGGAAVGTSAAGAVAVDELALRMNNLTRTGLDTALNIGGAAVLGGALGGIVSGLTPAARARAIQDIEARTQEPVEGLTIAEADAEIAKTIGGGSLSAADLDTVRFVGTPEGLTRAGRAVGEMSPAVAPSARAAGPRKMKTFAAIQQQFTTGGLKVTARQDPNSELGLLEPVAPGGQLEGLVRAKERSADAMIVDIISRTWADIEDIPGGLMWRGRTEAASILTGSLRKPKRMTWAEFSDELVRTMHRGDTSEVKEIEAAAKEIREKIIAPLTAAAQRAGILPQDLSEDMLKGAKSYLMRVYDFESMRRDPEGFKQLVIQSTKERLQNSWAEKLTKLREQQEEARLALQDRTQSVAEAERTRAELKAELEELSTGPKAMAVEEVASLGREAKALRKLAKEEAKEGNYAESMELDKRAQELSERAKELARLDREGDDAISEVIGRKRAINKRLRNLNRSIFKLQADQEKLLNRADKATEITVRELQGVSKRIVAAQQKLASADDDTFDELIDRAFKDLSKVYEQIEKREATIARLAERFPELIEAPAEFQERVQRFKESVFDVERFDTRGPSGEKMLKIDGELSQREALRSIDAVLGEGEYKIIDAQGNVTFEELTPRMTKSLKDWRDAIAKLRWADSEGLAKAEKRFEAAVARNAEAELRAEGLARRFEALRLADRDGIRAGLAEEIDNISKLAADRIHKRAMQEGRLRERARQYGAERLPQAEKEIAELKTLPETLEEEFVERLRLAGAEDYDLEKGVFDFERSLRERADELHNKMSTSFVRTPAFDLITGEKGPALVRMLDIDIEKGYNVGGRQVTMADFMVKDITAILRSYVRSIVPDTELAKRFNDGPGLGRWFGNPDSKANKEYNRLAEYIEKDLDENGVPLAKPLTREEKEAALVELSKDFEYGQRAAKVLTDRLRHVDGLPEDPTNFWYRLARTWRMAQVPMYMGMVAISSIPEVAMPVFKYGAMNTFRDSWGPLVTNYKEWGKAAAEAARAGQGLDPILNTRFMAWNDMEDMNVRYTRFEKMVEFFATKTGTVAMFDYWTKFSKMLAAPVASAQFTRAIETVMTGKNLLPQERALEILSNAGVNDAMASRLWRAMNEGEMTRGNGGAIIPNTDTWTDADARDVYRAYMSRELDITTITPGMERPMWTTSNEVARIINQFRSFGWSANTKMLLAGVQQRDRAVLQAYLAMLALGTVSYAGWAASFGFDSEQWKGFENADAGKMFDEALYRSGLLAAFGDVHSLLSDIPMTRGIVNASEQGAEKLRDPKILDTLIGVSATTFRRINTVLGGIDDPTQATTGALRKLTFYNNVWYFRRLLEEAESGAATALGIPEDRG